MTQLILASASPRRKELLLNAGWSFDVVLPDPGLEEACAGACPEPEELVALLAKLKAENVASRLRNKVSQLNNGRSQIIVGCDSIAVCRGQILGKPRDRNDARRMLRLLSGERHEVHTGICLIRLPDLCTRSAVETSILVMEHLDDRRLQNYLDSNLWQGKAGAFGWQDGNNWLRLESGSESNVVGLPLERFQQLYSELTQ